MRPKWGVLWPKSTAVLGGPRARGTAPPPMPLTPAKPVVTSGTAAAGFVQANRKLPANQKHSCLQGRGGHRSLGGTSKSLCSQAESQAAGPQPAGPQTPAGGGGRTGHGTRRPAEGGRLVSAPLRNGSGTGWLTV